jgi:UDP-2,3-diacylglucosamine pyrophosphatase LpxH
MIQKIRRFMPEITLPPGPDYALKVRFKVTSGWEQWLLLVGDCHWDSPECYIKLLHKHLSEAKDRNALIIDNGDLFEVISGRDDPRGSKGTIREEHNKVNYLDALVAAGVDEFRPYADNYLYCGTGNHEQSVLVRKETDLTARWIEKMNALRSPGMVPIHRAGYSGWIRFLFSIGTERRSWAMKLEHGTGGNSPVSKGVQMAPRRAARIEGATFVVTGHIHERWQVETVVETLNSSTGRVEQRPYEHIQIGSYKRDFRTDGVPTWWMMKSGQTKPIGGKWLRFYSPNGSDIRYEITSAWVDYPKLTDELRKSRVMAA